MQYVSDFFEASECEYPEEHNTLRHTELFNMYKELIDEKLSSAIKGKHAQAQFYEQCREVAEGKFVPIFSEHEHAWFVELVLSFSEYSDFFKQMISLARIHNGRKRK